MLSTIEDSVVTLAPDALPSGFFLGFLTSCGFISDLPHTEFCPGVKSAAAEKQQPSSLGWDPHPDPLNLESELN